MIRVVGGASCLGSVAGMSSSRVCPIRFNRMSGAGPLSSRDRQPRRGESGAAQLSNRVRPEEAIRAATMRDHLAVLRQFREAATPFVEGYQHGARRCWGVLAIDSPITFARSSTVRSA